jgi:hypothetical protein
VGYSVRGWGTSLQPRRRRIRTPRWRPYEPDVNDLYIALGNSANNVDRVGDVAVVLSRPVPQAPVIRLGTPVGPPTALDVRASGVDIHYPGGTHPPHARVARSTASLQKPLRTSFEVPCKAGRIVKDYVFDLYFPAQRLSWWQRLRCTPMILLIEYLVYRVDAVAERAKDVDLDAARKDDHDAARRYKATFEAYKSRFESLLRLAHAHNEAVDRQLDLGEQYVYLENKVTSNRTASHAEVLQLAELRPSDVRLLHAMTFALLGRPVDQDLLDLLWPVEVLADIGNDLVHYHEDIATGRFNTYDAFVRLYGRAAPDRLHAEIVRYEQLFHAELVKFPLYRRAELAALCTHRYRPRTQVIPLPQL